jgi:hypothetical protein
MYLRANIDNKIKVTELILYASDYHELKFKILHGM